MRAGVVVAGVYVLIGWRGLLVPSLIRSVEPTFAQTDAGMGAYFLATALAYAFGSLLGGRVIRARGSRLVLPLAAVVVAAGLATQGLTGTWPVFVLAGIVVSVGGSTVDVGINALILDLFPRARGRALNLLHLMYGVGALAAPLLLATMVAGGAPWQSLLVATGVAFLVGAIAMAATVPSRPARFGTVRERAGAAAGDPGPAGVAGADTTADPGTTGLRRLPHFLLVLAVAAACYVAAEAGVSNWLVRYLEDLPITTASVALTLFWGGIAAGRLTFARIGNRVEPQAAASALALVASVLLLVALLAPVSWASPFLFGLVGLALGPIFPLIMAAGGARLPSRSATVTSVILFAAVIGAVAYPPAIGFISVTIGLQAAMLGTAVLALACGLAIRAARGLVA
jgi:FHS family glucose/mannose:H+ symporter-like MFS transporter